MATSDDMGVVTFVNRRRGMFVLRTASGFCAMELLSGVDLQIGMTVHGPVCDLGGIELAVGGRRFSAYGQSGPSSQAAAMRLVR